MNITIEFLRKEAISSEGKKGMSLQMPINGLGYWKLKTHKSPGSKLATPRTPHGSNEKASPSIRMRALLTPKVNITNDNAKVNKKLKCEKGIGA